MGRQSSLETLKRLQRQSLGYVLIRCGQLFNERGIAAVNAQAGHPVLREAHTRLLPHLQSPDGVRVTTLAQTLGVTKQAVQQLVADLVEHGVVQLRRDPDDARARRVVLTSTGIQAMLHGTSVLVDIERALTPQLGRREVKALHRALSGLLTALEAPAAETKKQRS